jgi:hypothetical protein
VPAKAFLLMLTLNDTTYTCAIPHYEAGGMYTMADIVIPHKVAYIDSISITSDHDFDSTHPAGSKLNSLFNLSDTLKVGYVHGGGNNFYLMQSPSDSGIHVFTVHLYSSDSTRRPLTAQALPVKLLP